VRYYEGDEIVIVNTVWWRKPSELGYFSVRHLWEVDVHISRDVEVIRENVERNMRDDLRNLTVREPRVTDVGYFCFADLTLGVQDMLREDVNAAVVFALTPSPRRLAMISSAVSPTILPIAVCADKQ
jgi:hypothetical protein